MRTLIAFHGLRGNFFLHVIPPLPASATLSWFFFLKCTLVLKLFLFFSFWKPANGVVFVAFSHLPRLLKYLTFDDCFYSSKTPERFSNRKHLQTWLLSYRGMMWEDWVLGSMHAGSSDSEPAFSSHSCLLAHRLAHWIGIEADYWPHVCLIITPGNSSWRLTLVDNAQTQNTSLR